MDNPSLTKKRKISTPDGDILDLSAPTVRAKDFLSLVENMHFVAPEEAMRLDKIAYKYYGWADKIDAILWANNLYNPFAVDEGEWLIIPRVKDLNQWAVDPEQSIMPGVEEQTTSSKITSAANKLNASATAAKEERESKRNKRKTNEMAPGESSRKYRGAEVLLG